MTEIYHERDADASALAGLSVAVLGYGNQGRSWALNLRDSGLEPQVCVRADDSRDRALEDGFEPAPLEAASRADVVCALVPDDVIPQLPLERRDDALTVVGSGYTLAFGRFDPPGDVSMIAPRMLGPEVRLCYQEGIGFMTALGVHRDASGRALARTLALARALGGLRQGAIGLSPRQEAVLDLAVEQVLAPALTRVNESFVRTMLAQGIPLEAILAELVLSGEVERNFRLLREEGYAAQMEYHSPTSQYGQLSRRGAYDEFDLPRKMAELTEHIASGAFADEWDAESRASYARLTELKKRYCGDGVREMEERLRRSLGPGAPRA